MTALRGPRHDGRAPWFVLQHVDLEGPGLLAEVLAARGLELRAVRLDAGEALPTVGEVGALVVLGGPMAVGDTAVYPWLEGERALIAEAVGAGRAVLGICLGAQQLAAALGAAVYPAPRPEVGVGRVVLTPAGRRDRVFGPEYGGIRGGEIPCVHWHGDTFDLPAGAVHLAASPACPHQAFRVGQAAYGLQCHVEVDEGLARAWRPRLPEGAALPAAGLRPVEVVGRRLLGRFVDLALARRAVPPP